MAKLIRNFILKIILLTFVIGIICGAVFYILIPDKYFDAFPVLLIMFPVISIIVHIRLLKASMKSLAKFNVAFMLSFMLKLIVYAAVSGTIISMEVEHKTVFVITVLLLYLIFTVFDIKQVLQDIKKLNVEEKTE